MLAGAIAVSRARRERERDRAWSHDHAALREFRRVLRFSTHDEDAVAKECEAFQLLRLRNRPGALQAYLDLQKIAEKLTDKKRRDLTIARAKRFRAQILQGNAGVRGAVNAWVLIAGNAHPECSVKLREPHSSFVDWDALEQAEIHYVAAWIAHMCGFVQEEPTHLTQMEATLKDLLASLPKRRWFVPLAKRRLRGEAHAGLKRVARARTGDYDKDWLLV